jgi:hypothetical protein
MVQNEPEVLQLIKGFAGSFTISTALEATGIAA